MEELIYFAKANEAFERGDFRQCYIYLRRPGITDAKSLQLLVNACYFAWKKQDNSISLAEVKNAYSRYFGSVPPEKVSDMDFLRLSHIYICEGSLSGAGKITQLALCQGHMSSSLILLQSWTLLKRLNSAVEAEAYMEHLSEVIPMEHRGETEANDLHYLRGSDVPLVAPYMHCAMFVQSRLSKLKTANERLNHRYKFESLVCEAYFLFFNEHARDKQTYLEWYRQSSSWCNVAALLEDSLCPLLAEDCYWVAFCLSPRSSYALEKTLELMERLKRHYAVLQFFEKVYRYYKWNVYCRQQLVKRDDSGKYAAHFKKDHRRLSIIQGIARGRYVRHNWEAYYQKTMQQRGDYKLRVAQSLVLFEKSTQSVKRCFYLKWKAFWKTIMRAKRAAIIKVQRLWRGYYGRKCFRRKLWRFRNSHLHFISACEIHRNFALRRGLLQWNVLFHSTRNQRSADLIKLAVRQATARHTLLWALDVVPKTIQIRRNHCYPKVFKFWLELYKSRRFKRASNRIRAFVRFNLTARDRKEKIARLDYLYTCPTMMMLRARQAKRKREHYWRHWRKEFRAILEARANRLLVRNFSLLLWMRKSSEVLASARRAAEARVRLAAKVYRGVVQPPLQFWRKSVAMRRIQRRVRMWLAWRRRYRRHQLICDVEYKYDQCKKANCERRWNTWCSYVRYRRNIKLNASSIICVWFKKERRRAAATRCVVRKRYLSKMIFCIHTDFLRKAFRQYRTMVFFQRQLALIGRLFVVVRKWLLFVTFSKMKRFSRDQFTLHELVRITTHRLPRADTLSTKKYFGSHRLNDTTQSMFSHLRNCIKVARSHERCPFHITTDLVQLSQMFVGWKRAFKCRIQTKIESVHVNAQSLIDMSIGLHLMKTEGALQMQCLFRKYIAGNVKHARYLQSLRVTEFEDVVSNSRNFHIQYRALRDMRRLYAAKKRSRLMLQTWCRVLLSKKHVMQLKAYFEELNKKAIVVTRRRNLLYLGRILRKMEFGIVLRSGTIESSSEFERKIHFSTRQTKHKKYLLQGEKIYKGMKYDFKSEEFHSHLFRLKQTGIFILDSSSTMLRPGELAYLIQHASTIFAQAIGEHTEIADISSNFHGNKVIICGGVISERSARDLFQFLCNQEGILSLHFSDVCIPYQAVASVCRVVALNLAPIKEISVDIYSMGCLGLAAMITALRVLQ